MEVFPVQNETQDLNEPVSILAVIVLYRMLPSESQAFRSLQASDKVSRQNDVRLKILLYDNTPAPQHSESFNEKTEYWSAQSNQGIASAYNFALELAEAEGFDWLLTVDQDTTVPEHFLGRVAVLAKEKSRESEIAGFVPEVVDHGVFISPHVLEHGRSCRLPEHFSGVPDREVSAINSGALWRVRSLREIGGFNPLFWLDYLDHWLYRTMQHSGRYIYVAGDLTVEHELSLLNKDHVVSPARLANILSAESAFCDLYEDTTAGLSLTIKLLARAASQVVKGKNSELVRVTLGCFWQRIIYRKAARISKWEQSMKQRAEPGS
jgi:GT2 family glycosyltransferase